MRTSAHSFCYSYIQALSWCPWQSSLLATGGGSADKSICIWNACNGQLKCQMKTESQVSGLIWCHHHRELLSSHGNPSNKMNVWKLDQSSEETEGLVQVSTAIYGTAENCFAGYTCGIGVDLVCSCGLLTSHIIVIRRCTTMVTVLTTTTQLCLQSPLKTKSAFMIV